MRTESGNSVHLGYAKRQTKESPLSHWIISEQDLVMRVRDDFNKARTGYRAGVLEVPLANVRGFFSGVVTLKEGDSLVGEYKARTQGEKPRKSVFAVRGDREKLAAVAVDVILYSHAVLEETNDAESFADYEIISVNARMTYGRQPIAPMTLIHNHFGSDGGTSTNMSPEEFEAALHVSMEYWQDKVMLEGN